MSRARSVTGTREAGDCLIVTAVHAGTPPEGAFELIDGAGDGPSGYRASRNPVPGDCLGLYHESTASYAVRPAKD